METREPDKSIGCGVGIVGLGAALPVNIRANDFWSDAWRRRIEEDFIRYAERTALEADGSSAVSLRRVVDDPFRGAVERRVIADDEESSDLEVRACRAALACAGLEAREVDLLIGYSQVPDEAIPPNHGRNAHTLGMSLGTTAFTLDAGCASFLPHLTTATRLIQSGDHACALIYQSSATSRIIDYSTPSSPTIGDGAIATVVGRVPDGLGLVGRVQLTRGELHDGVVLARPSAKERWYEAPTTAEPMMSMSRDMEHAKRMGAEGPEFCRETCALLLDRHGLEASDVDFFVCAQSAAWWAEALANAVGIPEGRYLPASEHFQKFGHLLPASAPLNLWLAWRAGRLKRGDLVLAYTPGAGFIQAATLIRWAIDPVG